MLFKVVNRKNLVYYLHERKDKDGLPEYFFSRQQQKSSINELPEGYKVHEENDGRIILKKLS